MRSADGNEDTGVTNFQPAEAVNDGEAMDGEFFVDQRADLAHFSEGHGFVGLVLKI